MIRKKYIPVLLLLCFAVIPAHNMVPHHHHSGVIYPVHGEACPEGDHDHQDGPQDDHQSDHQNNHQKDHQDDHRKAHPVHCHAFNEISFYKNVLPGISGPSELPVLYAIYAAPADACNETHALKNTIVPPTVPYYSRYCGNQISLRGPPSAA